MATTHGAADWTPLNIDGAGLEADDHRPRQAGEPLSENVLDGMRPERKVARLALLWNLHMEDWGGRVAALLGDLGGRLEALEGRTAEVESSQDKLLSFRSNLQAFRTYAEQFTKELEAFRRGTAEFGALRQSVEQALAAWKPLSAEVERLRNALQELRVKVDVGQSGDSTGELRPELDRLRRDLDGLRAARPEPSAPAGPAEAPQDPRGALRRCYLAIALATALGVFASVLIGRLW